MVLQKSKPAQDDKMSDTESEAEVVAMDNEMITDIAITTEVEMANTLEDNTACQDSLTPQLKGPNTETTAPTASKVQVTSSIQAGLELSDASFFFLSFSS